MKKFLKVAIPTMMVLPMLMGGQSVQANEESQASVVAPDFYQEVFSNYPFSPDDFTLEIPVYINSTNDVNVLIKSLKSSKTGLTPKVTFRLKNSSGTTVDTDSVTGPITSDNTMVLWLDPPTSGYYKLLVQQRNYTSSGTLDNSADCVGYFDVYLD